MKLSEICALAKQGFTPKDIRELLELDENQKSNENSDLSPDDTAPIAKEPVEPVEVEPVEPDNRNDPDYKKLYTELSNEMNELKTKLKAAQQANINQDIKRTDKPNPEVALQDIVRSFM